MKIVIAVVLAWAGFLVHNFADLPDTSFADPNTYGPTLIWLALAVAYVARRNRLTAGTLFGWIVLNLVGGGLLSVLPVPILPYVPDQSIYHYSFHALYTVTQLPAAILLGREVFWGTAMRRNE